MSVTVGTIFTSTMFSARAEVVAVREEANEVDILFHPTNGHDFVEKNMSLKELEDGLSSGRHTAYGKDDYERQRILQRNDKNYTVW